MNAQDLKNSILQRAIEGKLVPQRAEEGTARDLLIEIRAEKEKLIKAKKIKKTKPLPEITDDEKPFDIPDSWEWVRLGNVGNLVRGSGIKRSDIILSGKPCIRYGELYTTYRTRFSSAVSQTSKDVFCKSKKVHQNDILMALTGENKWDIALAVVYEGTDEIAMGGDMTKWEYHGMNPIYLAMVINSPYGIACKRNMATGDIIVHISNNKLSEIMLPIPPLAEQQRIVARIEELQPDIDAYDKAQTELRTIEQHFPDDMKKSLLQYAIEGKLVPQRKEEGTARDLLAEIRAEKEKLIKAKKIKKTKPLPEITDDEKPFDIPDSWEWVRFEDIFGIARGGSPRPIKQFLTQSPDGINWIKIGDTDIGDKYIVSTKEKIIPKGLSKSRLVEVGDLLLTNSMSYGRPYILKTRGAIHDGWLVLSPYFEKINKEFFYYIISSPYVHNQFARTVSGAVVKNLNKDLIKIR
ncbi:restriction endonuclease subunit S [Megasphaera sp. CLA-AA-H81]|uniref:Restriction endonuclease subunit S n=1 Tax=Megasphaera intestinihominis TaxID=3133159 RepID=A0ABV1CWY5_9FIRM